MIIFIGLVRLQLTYRCKNCAEFAFLNQVRIMDESNVIFVSKTCPSFIVDSYFTSQNAE